MKPKDPEEATLEDIRKAVNSLASGFRYLSESCKKEAKRHDDERNGR